MIVVIGDKAFDSKLEKITVIFDDEEINNCLIQLVNFSKIISEPQKEEVLIE